MSGIVVPVDEDVAHTARVLEQVLVALEDRLPGATRAADQAAAIASSAAPGGPKIRVPVIAGVEQLPLAFLAVARPAALIETASDAIATDAPFEITEAVTELADDLLPGDAALDSGRRLRCDVARLLVVAGLDHGQDLDRLDPLGYGPGRQVHLTDDTAAAYIRVRDRIVAAWRPGDALAHFAASGGITAPRPAGGPLDAALAGLPGTGSY